MAVAVSRFWPQAPTQWQGRYARIPGDTSVFHLQYVEDKWWPVVIWKIFDRIATCPAIATPSVKDLAKAVTRAKLHAGGNGGGAFVIDEYGHVIVPASSGDGRRFLAGVFKGTMRFENPFDPSEPFDLAGDAYLRPGDPWKLPYVGMPYHLHRNGNIYFYQQDDVGGRSIYPPKQDAELIRSIRRVRPHGAARIVVTHAGTVLTKVPSGGNRFESEENWQSVYVGSINPNLWFDEE